VAGSLAGSLVGDGYNDRSSSFNWNLTPYYFTLESDPHYSLVKCVDKFHLISQNSALKPATKQQDAQSAKNCDQRKCDQQHAQHLI
jgi:hypothetical protein